jgi:hypothetical protein
MVLELSVAIGMLVLFLLYRAARRRSNRPRCPYFQEARRSPGRIEGQCSVSANPITDPRMTTGFQPAVCASAQYKSCPTFRSAKSGHRG